MQESDRLSTTAIGVALIALIVTLTQLVLQTLGTADGFRRCKRSVIGPWSKLTRLHWLWYEFRYETLYTSPEIALISLDSMSPKDMRESSRKLGMVTPIVRNGLVDQLTCLEREVGRKYSKSVWAYVSSFWSYMTSTMTYFSTCGLRKRQPKVDEPEDGLNIDARAQLPYIDQIRERHIRKASEAVEETVCAKDEQWEFPVNWVPFLKALHQNHVQQWPGECNCSAEPDKSAFAAAYPQFCKRSDTRYDNVWHAIIPGRSTPLLYLRERSWDFMPPDVIRPVASIQVRALIVLATRLGMQWSGLDLKSEGGMSAQGNSFYLTSVSLRGLGNAMQFGSDGRTAQGLGYIPTVAAEKLLCGILPGCGDLCPEVKIIGDDRTQSLISNFLEVLSLPKDVHQSLADFHFRKPLNYRENVFRRMPANDAMILFCPFLPKEMCTSVYCHFYAWFGQNQMSTFHLWEARRALLVQLGERIEALKELPKDHRMRYVNESLMHLEKVYESDFYWHRNTSLICGGPDEERLAFKQGGSSKSDFEQRRRQFLDCLRGVFEQTQSFFESLQSGRLPDSDVDDDFAEEMPDHKINYVDLVSANVELCHFAGQEARKRWEAQDLKHPKNFVVQAGEGFRECHEAASSYVEFRNHHEHGFFASLRRKGYKMEDLRMEEAWWMLMLRGIVWDMSCNCQNPGKPIPSSFYDNQRPVWMM